jgi:hypothetical protein
MTIESRFCFCSIIPKHIHLIDCHLSLLLFLFIDAIGKNGIEQCSSNYAWNVYFTNEGANLSEEEEKKTIVFFHSCFFSCFEGLCPPSW